MQVIRFRMDFDTALDRLAAELAERSPPVILSRDELIRRLAEQALMTMGLLEPKAPW